MMNHGIHHVAAPLIGLSLLFLPLPAFSGVQPADPGGKERPAVGLVTGLIGQPYAGSSLDDREARPLKLGDRVAAGESVRTGPEGRVELVWDHRAFVAVHEGSHVTINEPQVGHTDLQLQEGSVRVALTYRAGRPTDIVTVYTPTSRVMTRGGIVEVGVSPPSSHLSFFARVTEAFVRLTSQKPAAQTVASAGPETVRIIEGQARIEPLASEARSQLVDARSQVRLVAGSIAGMTDLPRGTEKGVGLAAVAQQATTPAQITQRIVGLHVQHALDVERSIQKSAATDQKPDVTQPDVRGTVLPTSLGVPSAPVQTGPVTATQPTPTAPTPPSPTVAPAPPPPPPTVVAPPPAPAPAPIPIPTLPPPTVTTPSVSSFAPTQSGGINSDKLLKDLLRGDDDKRGRNRGRGGRDD